MHRLTTTETFSFIHKLENCYRKLLKIIFAWINCLVLRLKTDIFCQINLSRILIWPWKWIKHILIFWVSDFGNKTHFRFFGGSIVLKATQVWINGLHIPLLHYLHFFLTRPYVWAPASFIFRFNFFLIEYLVGKNGWETSLDSLESFAYLLLCTSFFF